MEYSSGGFVNPSKVLLQLNIEPGTNLADFGCGHGYFSIPAAKLTGDTGRVWAIDILPDALEAVRSRAQIEKLSNIETLRVNLENFGSAKISDNSIDMVLLHNILFQSRRKESILKEVKRVLRPGGSLDVIDWRPEKDFFGPKEGWRLSAAEARKMAENEGFVFVKEFDAGEYHFGLMFKKP
ncbi:MAG: class I SAM-dependent methyltransferase [Candidatus Portnoybacteria bacterium]|nr:class I SAM-dependent methyltransferase [Candidatus Portnoybacteria bacterium]